MIRTGVVCTTLPPLTPQSFSAGQSSSNQSSYSPSSSGQNNVKVELTPLLGCGSCASAGGCGVKLLPVNEPKLIVECTNPNGIRLVPGANVQVELPEPSSSWVKLVGLAYGLPTLGMLIGVFLGDYVAKMHPYLTLSASFSVLGFFLGLAGGLFAWSRLAVRSETRHCVNTRGAHIVGTALVGLPFGASTTIAANGAQPDLHS